MRIDAEISASEDLLGKYVDDLQSNIVIGDTELSGTSKYVTGYTGYSGDVDLQEGNYLALHASAGTGVTIQAKLIGGVDDARTLDADGLLVARLSDDVTGIRFIASLAGVSQVKELSFRALVKEAEEEE